MHRRWADRIVIILTIEPLYNIYNIIQFYTVLQRLAALRLESRPCKRMDTNQSSRQWGIWQPGAHLCHCGKPLNPQLSTPLIQPVPELAETCAASVLEDEQSKRRQNSRQFTKAEPQAL